MLEAIGLLLAGAIVLVFGILIVAVIVAVAMSSKAFGGGNDD